MSIETSYLDEVAAALEQWDDQRVILADDLEDLLLFWKYVPKVLSQSGRRMCGYQVRQKDGNHLLTVKVMEGDTPLIAYLTSATPMGCVRLFVSQLEGDRLIWHRDRYPWI